MKNQWEKELSCAIACHRCNATLSDRDPRILSVFDHQPICLACKQKEETQADYAVASKEMIGTCMMDTEQLYSDPSGYCFFHFYPFSCEK